MIQTANFLIILVHIYAPNSDDPEFFKKVADHITNFTCEEIVIDGDFNLTVNIELDKVGGRKTNHARFLAVLIDRFNYA